MPDVVRVKYIFSTIANYYIYNMVAISKRLRALRRSRVGGRPPRSPCSGLKSVVDCSGNVECVWNDKLSKCRKATAKRALKKKFMKLNLLK